MLNLPSVKALSVFIFANLYISFVYSSSVLVSDSVIALLITTVLNLSYTLLLVSMRSGKLVNLLLFFLLLLSYVISFFYQANYLVYDTPLSFSSLASVFESNLEESFGFIQSTSFSAQLYLLLPVILVALMSFTRINELPTPWRVMSALPFVGLVLALTVREIKVKQAESGLSATAVLKPALERTFNRLGSINLPTLMLRYVEELEKFNKPLQNSWEGVAGSSNQTHILVIGESASRNHMSLYGYSRQTTPLLDSLDGLTYVDMAIAPATQTRDSLLRILTLNDEDYRPQSSLNLIGLANKAGLKTYWISNQGRLSSHDTPISRIANISDSVTYINNGSYHTVGMDDVVLKSLEKVLAEPAEKKLIVIHLMGSHARFSDRTPERYFKGNNESIDYYDSSIRFTDIVLKRIIEKAKITNSKLMYFSDHALKAVDFEPYLIHGMSEDIAIESLQVPLVFFDPNVKGHNKIDTTYYMFDMLHTLADWLAIDAIGIQNNKSIISASFDSMANEKLVYNPIYDKNIDATKI